jgi:hypothetical protein
VNLSRAEKTSLFLKINWNCNPAHPPELHQTACLTNLVEAPGKNILFCYNLCFRKQHKSECVLDLVIRRIIKESFDSGLNYPNTFRYMYLGTFSIWYQGIFCKRESAIKL